ncbi:MAG: DUF2357 domain-containing protein [Planctomycetaceae bacterium]|nr:DUF2357 domain-containing protein [Planctomycetaceae bacterium]
MVHRDPFIVSCLSNQENGNVLHGTLNFRGQIGRSTFTVCINDRPVLDLDLEVFPTKIDYETDYREILADLQQSVRSLAYEYLRSTFQFGKVAATAKPTQLEWLLLLREVIEQLRKAIQEVSHHPRRGLVRRARVSRIEKIKKLNSALRGQIRRGQGRGMMLTTVVGCVREQLIDSSPESTLDTAEHRWLKRQLTEIQQELARISQSLDHAEQSARKAAIVSEVVAMEQAVTRMLTVEPIREANGDPPPGFASLALLSSPGYREAYQTCMLLKMGLRLEGDAFRVSVKDLNVLYEYWVFFAMVEILRQAYGDVEDFGNLFRLQRSGLHVGLIQGRQQSIHFTTSKTSRITITYNPQFQNKDTTLVPQKPDILIRCEHDGWPQLQLICDAKYRIDATEEYRSQFGIAGPPRDAINVLHRYRDAILEFDQVDPGGRRPKRSVVQAAALFPFMEARDGEFRESRLWTSIERLGIGAIPALPSGLGYLREWLLGAIQQGGWAMSDRIIPHAVEERAADWRDAARDPVLVGVLDSGNARSRFDWISKERLFYIPRPKKVHRHFRVVAVALYCPRPMLTIPSIAYVAEVEDIQELRRGEIDTPWSSRTSPDAPMLAYRLGPIRPMPRVLENTDGTQTSFRGERWTTRLALRRATTAAEIALETEPEWRLYELLHSMRIQFELRLGDIAASVKENPVGRASFRLRSGPSIRYDGANGFEVIDALTGRATFQSFAEVQETLHQSHR